MTSRPLALGVALLVSWTLTQAAKASGSARIPPVHGTTFANAKVDLPEALNGKVGILVVSFTEASRDAVTTWGKKLAVDYYDSPTVLYYEMPMLAAVPRLMRGLVANHIKASVSDRGKPHFLPVTDDEPAWRAAVHYTNPDDPYILLVDDHGTIRWQTQGAPTDATYAALKQQVVTFGPH